MKQLHFQISRFAKFRSIQYLIQEELNNPRNETVSHAIESVLKFLRQWCEFHFPRYLSSLDRIQHSVFLKHGYESGDYAAFIQAVKHLFMHPSVTVLEEYGLPYSITQKILESYELGDEVDDFLTNLKDVDPSKLDLTNFEVEMFLDSLENI